MHAKYLLLRLWAKAATTVVHVLNRFANKRLNMLTPYVLYFEYLDLMYINITQNKLCSKLEAKSERFVSVDMSIKGSV